MNFIRNKLEQKSYFGKDQVMKIRIVIAGKPALSYAKIAMDEYLKRMNRYHGCEMIVVRAGDQETVSKRLLENSQACYRVALDERGLSLSTRQLSAKIEELERDGLNKTLAFLIGAADGHTENLRDQCDLVLSLSKMTMQHELALIVLLEQIYRVACLKAGSPYHRD